MRTDWDWGGFYTQHVKDLSLYGITGMSSLTCLRDIYRKTSSWTLHGIFTVWSNFLLNLTRIKKTWKLITSTVYCTMGIKIINLLFFFHKWQSELHKALCICCVLSYYKIMIYFSFSFNWMERSFLMKFSKTWSTQLIN